MNNQPLTEEQVRQIFQEEFQANYSSGNTKIPPHQHNGIDNLQLNPQNFLGWPIFSVTDATVAPTDLALNGVQRFQFDGTVLTEWVRTNQNWYQIGSSGGGGGSPGAPVNSVQYNNPLGTFAGNEGFTFLETDPIFSLPILTIGSTVVPGGIISGGDWVGGIGTEYLRIITNNNANDASLTRSIFIGTGDTGGDGSVSGDIFINTGLPGTGAGTSGNININTGDTTFGAVGSALIMRAGTVSSSGNTFEIYGNTIITGGITNPAQSYSPTGGSTATLDLSLSNQHYIQMPAGNITIALSNSTLNQIFLISITQDSVGSRTVTWFTTIRWAGGSAPTLTTTANKRDTFGFIRTGSGTYDGFVIGQNI